MSQTSQPRFGLAIGLSCALAGMAQYVSYERRPIMGRWSYPYALVLGVMLMAVIVVVASILLRRSRPQDLSRASKLARDLAGWAAGLWGVGYMVEAFSEPVRGGRILDLNVVGSSQPLVAAVEWVAMVLVVVAVAAFTGPRIRASLREPMLTVLWVVSTLMVMEGAARLRAIVFPASRSIPTYSEVMWRRRYVELNNMGFRDARHPIEAPPGEHRLLHVGDSFAFGAGLKNASDRLGEILASRLSDLTGVRWVSLNAGVADTHTLEHIEFLKRMLVYEPDLIILEYVYNDLDYLAPVTPRIEPGVGRGVLAFLNPRRLAYQNSYLFQELYLRLRLLRSGEPEDLAGLLHRDPSIMDRHLADLGRFVSIARATGAGVRIVIVDPTVVVSDRLASRLMALVGQFERAGLPVCAAGPSFRGHGFDELTVNSLDRHPSALANHLAAEDLGPCVAEAIGEISREGSS